VAEPMLAVGLLFRGYCQGYFGRDGYGDKRVEAFGADWLVVRYASGYREGSVGFASFDSQDEMLRLVAEFAKERGPDEG